jgi:hypothetical protein
MAGGYDLIEQIRGLLIGSQIAKLVDDKRRGLRLGLELTYQRVINWRGEQVIQHVHRGGEQDAPIGLADTPANDLG